MKVLSILQSYAASYYTLAIVMIGTMTVGATAAGIGVFSLLRRQSLLGDAISHAALPGIALMFMYSQSTNPFLLLFGGGIAGCIGAFLVLLIAHTTSLKQDALLGIILSVFFGFGVVLKTIIQKEGLTNQAVLGKFFFGNASTLSPIDIIAIISMSLLIFILLYVWWKEFVIISFDPEFAHTLGYQVFILEILLTITTVFAIVIGLHTVGVLLMSALLIAPAAAARQLTTTLQSMFWVAIFFGIVACATGTLISSWIEYMPTGPAIVVCMSSIVILTFIVAPKRITSRGES